MIDLASETLLTLEAAAQKLSVSTATLHRWIRCGTKGIKLEAAKLGGRWRTSEEAIQRFSDRLTPNHQLRPHEQPTTPIETPRQRRLHEEQIERKLDEMFGIRRCETCQTEIKAPKGTLPKNERLWCPKCLVLRKSATIGKRIRTFRWDAMLSKQKLSEITHITLEKIRSYENDETKPSEEHLERLVQALGKDLVSNYSR